jgi:hydrogenase-4 component F
MSADLASLPAVVILLPLLGAAILFAWPKVFGGWTAVCVSTATLVLACLLPARPLAGPLLLVDGLSAHFAMLTAAVAAAAAWSSRLQPGLAEAGGFHDALLLALLGSLQAAVLANNLCAMWIAIEAATILGVFATALAQTPEATDAAQKYFLLCGAAVVLAFVGVVVLYLAAIPATGAGLAAMSWSTLASGAPFLPAPLLDLAFVLLLVGFATTAALAPLHSWMPDVQAAGPTAICAVMGGPALNVALVGLLRLRGLLAVSPGAVAPGPPLLVLGLLSVLLGAFGLWRCGDAKRFFALTTLQQNGLCAVAFGLGGPLATFAGLLHMTLHTLTRTAVFQVTGALALQSGTRRFAAFAGLWTGRSKPGFALGAGMLGLAALPPSGLFVSTLLVVLIAVREAPLAAVPLVVGLVAGIFALLARLAALAGQQGSPPSGQPAITPAALWPAWLMLGAVALVGIAMPAPFAQWLRGIAAGLP